MSIATIVAVVLVLAAIVTMLPRASSRKRCMLGYKALCTFSPISSIVLVVIAAFVWLLGNAA